MLGKAKIWFLFIFIMFGLVLAACGGKSTQVVPTPEVASPTPELAATPLIDSGISAADEAASPTPEPTATAVREVFTMVPSGGESLCENSFSSPVAPGAAASPVRTLVNQSYEGAGWVNDFNLMVIPHIEPWVGEDVFTLVCIREDRVQEITYADGGPGYRLNWEVSLVTYPEGTVVGSSTFAGEPPPDEESWENMKEYIEAPPYGDRPADSLLEWLYPLLGEQRVLTTGFTLFNMELSPGGDKLAAGGSGNLVKIWNLNTREVLRTLDLGEGTVYVDAFAFSPDGSTLAIPDQVEMFNWIKLWDLDTGETVRVFSSQEYIPTDSLATSPDGKMLASGSWDGMIYLWDVTSGQVIYTLSGHTERITSLAFSPDGKLLASGSDDQTVILWDMATRQIQHILKSHTDYVNSLAISPDGKLLASGSDDNTVILWDLATGEIVKILQGEDHVTSLAFSPDGKILATGEVLYVKLWDTTTGALLNVFEGHTDSVDGVAFTQDGQQLISGSQDTTLRFWDLANP